MRGEYRDGLEDTQYKKARELIDENDPEEQRKRKQREYMREWYRRNPAAREKACARMKEGQRKRRENPEYAQKQKEYMRAYNAANKGRSHAIHKDPETGKWKRGVYNPELKKGHHVKHLYNMGLADYDKLYQSQDGKCAICRTDIQRHSVGAKNGIKTAHIDHCHATDTVRGLLCSNCNHLLGQAKDNIEILKAAIKYLEEN
jgi:Recombination endonuclease VII